MKILIVAFALCTILTISQADGISPSTTTAPTTPRTTTTTTDRTITTKTPRTTTTTTPRTTKTPRTTAPTTPRTTTTTTPRTTKTPRTMPTTTPRTTTTTTPRTTKTPRTIATTTPDKSTCAYQSKDCSNQSAVYCPQCDTSGNFLPQQCWASTGDCWCVNTKNGMEIPNTRTGPGATPTNCSKLN